ncbi:hypothetical protein FBEOM_4208 [Fusarium beomiforme]|uniref:Uncharacterized protein n=1 Tax=Fusarium beomiforme TaxID=44412 RepID=A0A9P5DYH1_9HYPO|nr:hypothetical protein FBEOM_4208 [Fusarium beomiforme]
MSQTALASKSVARDPFERLPVEIREIIITYLGSYRNFDRLCLASPTIRQDRRTSKLLVCSESLDVKFGSSSDGALIHAHMYLLISKEGISDKDMRLWRERSLPHPLFSTRPGLVFQMDALYHSMMDRFKLGSELVLKFVRMDRNRGNSSYLATASFGIQGELFPTTLKYAKNYKKGQVFGFLMSLKMREDSCLSEFSAAWDKIYQLEQQGMLPDHDQLKLPRLSPKGNNAQIFMKDLMDYVHSVKKFEADMEELCSWSEEKEGEEQVFTQC